MRALLDVSFLIALLDSAHGFHAPARRWLEDNIEHGWASCPITQNGCIRILSQKAYPKPVPVTTAAALLREAQATRWHRFWPDSLSVLDEAAVAMHRVHGSGQITDAYLLALAVANNGRLVTFDERIATATVPGATVDHLVCL